MPCSAGHGLAGVPGLGIQRFFLLVELSRVFWAIWIAAGCLVILLEALAVAGCLPAAVFLPLFAPAALAPVAATLMVL